MRYEVQTGGHLDADRNKFASDDDDGVSSSSSGTSGSTSGSESDSEDTDSPKEGVRARETSPGGTAKLKKTHAKPDVQLKSLQNKGHIGAKLDRHYQEFACGRAWILLLLAVILGLHTYVPAHTTSEPAALGARRSCTAFLEDMNKRRCNTFAADSSTGLCRCPSKASQPSRQAWKGGGRGHGHE